MKKLFAWLGGPKAPAAPAREGAPQRTLADIEMVIAREDLAPAGDLVRRRVLPCLHVIADGEAPTVLGATRFGGLPDLPASAIWPVAPNGDPLMFLAQLDLAALVKHTGPTALPSEGLLSIFAGNLQGDPDTSAAAIFTLPGAALVRAKPPQHAPNDDADFRLLNTVAVRVEMGVTLPLNETLFTSAIEQAAPDGNMDALMVGPYASPDHQIAQLLGHANSPLEDLHGAIALRELGWPGKETLLIWRTWEDWEQAKTMESKLRNGTVYRPWRASDDDAMRWILANRDRIAAESERWQVLLKVESNKPMNLWINDADPVFIFIRTDDLVAGAFTNLRALATQG